MWYRLSIAATAGLMLGGAGAAAAELPTYEVMGLPITPHQLAALGPANAQERAPDVSALFMQWSLEERMKMAW